MLPQRESPFLVSVEQIHGGMQYPFFARADG